MHFVGTSGKGISGKENLSLGVLLVYGIIRLRSSFFGDVSVGWTLSESLIPDARLPLNVTICSLNVLE